MEAPLQVSELSVIYDYVTLSLSIKRPNVHCTIFSAFFLLTVELTQLP